LSANGDRVAVGSMSNNSYVYEYDGISTWNQVGNTVVLGTEINNSIFSSVALSGDGLKLGVLVGTFRNRVFGTDLGAVYILNYDSTLNKWVQQGEKLTSILPYQILQSQISLSMTGNTIAFGTSFAFGPSFTGYDLNAPGGIYVGTANTQVTQACLSITNLSNS
jgi:hypothetical protein